MQNDTAIGLVGPLNNRTRIQLVTFAFSFFSLSMTAFCSVYVFFSMSIHESMQLHNVMYWNVVGKRNNLNKAKSVLRRVMSTLTLIHEILICFVPLKQKLVLEGVIWLSLCHFLINIDRLHQHSLRSFISKLVRWTEIWKLAGVLSSYCCSNYAFYFGVA